MDPFKLGVPAIVCRWRLASGKLPLENRHLRALAGRRDHGATVSQALVAWAKQHIEWTLLSGSREHPDGVLMLVIDEDGRAAMSVGPYKPLAHVSANDLLQRALTGRKEAYETGVSPEDLWVVWGNELVWGTSAEFLASGSSSLIADLARTLGMPMRCDDTLLERMSTRGFAEGEAEVFLVSDEHGIVVASDHAGERAQKFAASYERLRQRT